MVQVLPEVPSFGASLGKSIGTGFSKGISQGMEMAMQMALEKQKQQSKKDLYKDLFSPQGQPSQDGSKFQALTPEQEMMLAFEDPKAFNAYSKLKENEEKKEEKTRVKENLSSTMEEMVNTLLEGNLGYTHKRFGAKGRRDAQYFNSLSTELESIGKDMVSKGILSNARFAFLLGNLPSAGKTDATNAGALEVWAKELELDIPGIERLESIYQSEENLKKVEKGKKLDEETMALLYKKTGGDKEKIKKMAKKMGYDIE